MWFDAAHTTLEGTARGAKSDCTKVKLPVKKINRDVTCVQHHDTWVGGGKTIKGSRERCFLSELLKVFQIHLN